MGERRMADGPPDIAPLAILLPSLAIVFGSAFLAWGLALICVRNNVKYSFDDQPA